MTQKPYLNLGCGKIQLPCERPLHHGLVDGSIYHYPLWHNVDKVSLPGVDEAVDIFAYPWPWEDNAFDGALLSHLVEHIPHEINAQTAKLKQMQDGWYTFFSELWRVLTPGAIAHILAPYGWSQGALSDPTHTRQITEYTFTHSMKPEDNGTFQYETGGLHFEMTGPAIFRPTELFQHVTDEMAFRRLLQTQINVVYEVYVRLEAVKDGEN